MKNTLRLLAVLLVFFGAAASADPALDHAKEVLGKSILIDGHNDLPWAIRGYEAAPGDVVAYDLRKHAPGTGETDIPRLREGRVGGQFWSVYIPPEADGHFARTQLEQIDIARRMIERYPDALTLAGTAADVRAARKPPARSPRMLGVGGRPRDRELAGGAARLLRPRRALHDADPQQAHELGRRRGATIRPPTADSPTSASRSCTR